MTDKKIDIKANLRIEVTRDNELDYYVSRIDDIDEYSFYIPVPYANRRALDLAKGESVTIKFTGERESYLFKSIVLDVRKEKVKIYQLGLPSEIVRVQQRNFVRVPVLLDALYALPPDKNSYPKFQIGKILDISAGGVKLASRKKFDYGEVLLLKLKLPPVSQKEDRGFSATLKTSVIRRTELQKDGQTLYHLGLKFLDITQKQRDEIMRFIFQKMIKNGRYS